MTLAYRSSTKSNMQKATLDARTRRTIKRIHDQVLEEGIAPVARRLGVGRQTLVNVLIGRAHIGSILRVVDAAR